jgi:hypothetical protein
MYALVPNCETAETEPEALATSGMDGNKIMGADASHSVSRFQTPGTYLGRRGCPLSKPDFGCGLTALWGRLAACAPVGNRRLGGVA